MQSKKDSLKETLTNTFVGTAGSFAITMLVLKIITIDIPLFFGYFIPVHIAIAAVTTVLCTVWSIARGYTIRRFFNKKVVEVSNGGA